MDALGEEFISEVFEVYRHNFFFEEVFDDIEELNEEPAPNNEEDRIKNFRFFGRKEFAI